MRLIDADRFYINYARRFSREPLKVEIFKQFIDAEPTVCDIEQIRDEIAKLRDSEQHGNMIRLYGWDSMKKKVLQIIDKYTKGE